MNKKGFTLIELLAVLAIIGLITVISFYLIRGTTATTLTQIENIENHELYQAASNYVMEQNKPFNSDGYLCITLKDLVDLGYAKGVTNTSKMIKITRNNKTKVIEEIEYVDECK